MSKKSSRIFNRSSNEIENISTRNIYFPVYFLQCIFNALGLNITFNTLHYNYKYKNMIFKIAFYVWNIINAFEIVFFLSNTIATEYEDVKTFISHTIQRICCLSYRMVLYIKRSKFTHILIKLNSVERHKRVNCMHLKCMITFTIFYIHVLTFLAMHTVLKDMPIEMLKLIASMNIFGIQSNDYFAEIFVPFVLFIYFYVTIVFPSITALIYIVFSNIMKNEFLHIKREVNKCKNQLHGRIILHKYDEVIHISKKFDEAMGLPVFSVLVFILSALFLQAYNLFAEDMPPTNDQVIKHIY